MIALVLRKVDWAVLGTVLIQTDLRWVLAGSAATLVLIAGLALRWKIFLRQQDIDVGYQSVIALTWAGQFFNSILPGSTGGDVVKLIHICRLAPERKAAAAATVFVDRLVALIALLMLAGAAVIIDPKPIELFVRRAVPLNAAMLYVGLFVALCMAAAGWLLLRMFRGSQWHGRVTRTLVAARSSLQFNGTAAVALLLALAIHLVNFLSMYFFARALHIPITYAQVVLMMPVILFLVMIPITINGHGLREVLLIGYLGYIGVAAAAQPDVKLQETAVALSIVAVANDMLWSLPGGVLYFANFRVKERRRDPALAQSDTDVIR